MNKRGFTLIELLITMFVSMILLAGAVSVVSNQLKVYSGQTQALGVIQDSRLAMDVISKDIRMAGFKPNGSTIVGIPLANGTTIRVLSDLNQDNVITAGTDEDITISFDSNSKTLTRNNNLLLSNVESFGFTYTLKDGSTTTTPTDLSKIRRVGILLVLLSDQIDPSTNSYKRINMSSEITPRNIQ